MNLTNLKQKASKLSSDYSADVFHLIDADGCSLCCSCSCGGNVKEKPSG